LLDRAEGAAIEFFCDGIGACRIFIDDANQFNRLQFAGELVIDAGMIASERAYADYGNGNGI
jgi:hypothetical protein